MQMCKDQVRQSIKNMHNYVSKIQDMMEIIQFSFFLNILLLIIFLIMLTKHQTTNNKSPPGPWRLRFIGSLYHLVTLCSTKKAKEVTKTNDLAGDSPEDLPATLQRELMPRHVAVIMDGNRRWARQQGLPSWAGHEAGAQSVKQLVELCGRCGIKVLTVFAFSTENWIRPQAEVEFLMGLLERVIISELENFRRDGIRLSVIGDSSKLPESVRKAIHHAEDSTKENSRFHYIMAVSYSGKYDIVQACKSIARKASKGFIEPEDINETLIEQELETNCTEYPYPDLLIRTSGELRVSNFLLWQLAYTEFFFSKKLWPDFGKDEFIEALTSYQQRQRRFGGQNS